MQKERLDSGAFIVSYADKRDIGEDWNLIEWNKKHREIDCHRLYFRSDSGEAKAFLRLIDCDIELLPGKVYFIPAFSILQSEIDGVMHKYYIHFRTSDTLFNLYRFISDKYCVDAKDMSEELFRTVVENYTKDTPDAAMRVEGAMKLLLADFLDGSDTKKRSVMRFSPVLSYIEENYKRTLTLDELSSIMNMSSKHFSRAFRQTFRTTPHQYVINKRLTESQQLLLEGNLSVKEIAYAVGFENENYFSELFSDKIGISPLKFRKRALPQKRASIL